MTAEPTPSDTPRTDELGAKWVSRERGPGFDISPEASELYEHARQLERELNAAHTKLEEADTALRIRATECLMQSQRAEQAQSRLAEMEKNDARYRWMAENWAYADGCIFFEDFNLGPLTTLDQAIDTAIDEAIKRSSASSQS